MAADDWIARGLPDLFEADRKTANGSSAKAVRTVYARNCSVNPTVPSSQCVDPLEILKSERKTTPDNLPSLTLDFRPTHCPWS